MRRSSCEKNRSPVLMLRAQQPVWLSLFKGYIAFYKATVPDEVIEGTWARLMAGAADFHCAFVAVDDADSPIGLAHVIFHYLEDLFVDPERRQKGTGRALIEAVYAEADARGCTRTYWTTQEFNYRARSLYDQVATKSPFLQYRR